MVEQRTGAAGAITVNGERRELAREMELAELLAGLGHDPRAVAVELNGRVLKRAELPATRVRDGDRLEIVRFVQGG
ncbi:MAG: sulfur carrier protein ThiS [Thermoanaerobaculia bacterium]|nr:sulfur carrier protein ThiS [Thermoanaerobaculia bacterium]